MIVYNNHFRELRMNKVTMYMVTHKDVDFIPRGRTPIFVGAGDNKKGFLRDNTGENISEKNKNYCELTAIYWIWKNDKESEYVSIEHYRRFFSNKFFAPAIICNNSMKKILESGGIVTSKICTTKMTIGEFYRKRHEEEDIVAAEEAIRKFYPDYLDIFATLMNGHKGPMFNMVAMKKKDFDAYCEWLFKILFYVENKVDLSGRSVYQQRAFGFLSERLLNVWVEKNSTITVRLPIYHRETSGIRSFFKTMKSWLPHRSYDPKKPKG